MSPWLVDAVSSSMKVVWANCAKQEGLLGRTDVCLQTAVGVPVAVDNKGNICIVILFSRNNILSNNDAMEYLQFISKCASSHSIPCLLPVVGVNENNYQDFPSSSEEDKPGKNQTMVRDGVTARFVSFNEKISNVNEKTGSAEVEIQSVRETLII